VKLRQTVIGMTLLSVIGLGISLYLTYIYTSGGIAICGGSGGCAEVQSSPYAWIFGIPIPTLGAVAYVVLIALGFLAMRESARRDTYILALFGVSLVGLLFSAYLTYLELFVIFAICLWCVGSAVVQLIVFLLSLLAVRQANQEG